MNAVGRRPQPSAAAASLEASKNEILKLRESYKSEGISARKESGKFHFSTSIPFAQHSHIHAAPSAARRWARANETRTMRTMMRMTVNFRDRRLLQLSRTVSESVSHSMERGAS